MDRYPLPTPWGPEQAKSLSLSLRESKKNHIWDIVIVGAGITGAGIARDAAMRGLQTLVIDQGDVASGTSSRSSRLVHGGVRYLEHGDFSLVHEALRERSVLYKIAPHLVRPERFRFLSYRGDRLGILRLRAGLTLYDALNLFRGDGHQYLSPKTILQQEPSIAESELLGAIEYEDALTDDTRLTLATLQSARRYGAEVLTYNMVQRVYCDPQSQLHCLELEENTKIRAHQVVCALGPWSTQALLGDVARNVLMTSKGIHLVFLAKHLPVRKPMVIQASDRQRILFAIPWGNRTYVGTTDDHFEGNPGHAQIEREDILGLLEELTRVFPQANVNTSHIVGAWVGIRPLVRKSNSKHNTSRISRNHRILERDDGILAILGGKLTTYRSMAEEILERTRPRLSRFRPELVRSWPRSKTKDCPLVENLNDTDEIEEPYSALRSNLYQRHGLFADSLVEQIKRQPVLAEPIFSDLPYRWIEVHHAIYYEGARHLDDIVRRRIPINLLGPSHPMPIVQKIATELVQAWGGTPSDINEELERYHTMLELERPDCIAPAD